MPRGKQHVFSARTTPEGLGILNGIRAERKIGWDELVIGAVNAHYGVKVSMPPRAEPKAGQTKAKAGKPKEKPKPKAEKPKAKAKGEVKVYDSRGKLVRAENARGETVSAEAKTPWPVLGLGTQPPRRSGAETEGS